MVDKRSQTNIIERSKLEYLTFGDTALMQLAKLVSS